MTLYIIVSDPKQKSGDCAEYIHQIAKILKPSEKIQFFEKKESECYFWVEKTTSPDGSIVREDRR